MWNKDNKKVLLKKKNVQNTQINLLEVKCDYNKNKYVHITPEMSIYTYKQKICFKCIVPAWVTENMC